MALYGYARVSVRSPRTRIWTCRWSELVRAGCSMGNIRAEEASGAKDDRGGLLELLDLVVEGDTVYLAATVANLTLVAGKIGARPVPVAAQRLPRRPQ